MPCAITVPRAHQPRTRIQRRWSTFCVQTRNANGQQADELGQHAVTVLELDPADQRRNAVERAERGGPVRHGKSRFVAGHQSSGDDQQEDARPPPAR